MCFNKWPKQFGIGMITFSYYMTPWTLWREWIAYSVVPSQFGVQNGGHITARVPANLVCKYEDHVLQEIKVLNLYAIMRVLLLSGWQCRPAFCLLPNQFEAVVKKDPNCLVQLTVRVGTKVFVNVAPATWCKKYYLRCWGWTTQPGRGYLGCLLRTEQRPLLLPSGKTGALTDWSCQLLKHYVVWSRVSPTDKRHLELMSQTIIKQADKRGRFSNRVVLLTM